MSCKIQTQIIQVIVNVFVTMEAAKLQHQTANTDCRTHGVTEIVQTDDVILIPPESIHDFAFVFPLESFLTDEVFWCPGMSNLFLLQYRTDSKPVASFKPFPCDYTEQFTFLPDDYSFRIFHDLMKLRRTLSRLMGRYSMKQGRYVKNAGELVISREFWHYLTYRFSGSVSGYEPKNKRRRIDRVLLPNFTLKSVRRTLKVKELHFQSALELSKLTNVLGHTSLF